MNIPLIKRKTLLLSKEEIGLLKLLTHKVCVLCSQKKLSVSEPKVIMNFFTNFNYDDVVNKLILANLSIRENNDIIITSLGMQVGGYNGASEIGIDSTDLINWYHHGEV